VADVTPTRTAQTGRVTQRPTRQAELADVSVRCPLCAADTYHVRFEPTLSGPVDPQRFYTSTSHEFGRCGRIVECRNCSLVYMNPRPHHQRVQQAYGAVEDRRYLEEEAGREATFAESLRHVRRFVPEGRLLDVGCHVGTFLVLAEEAGFTVSGVEPSRWAASVARGRIAGPVHQGAVEDAPVPADSFDAITMWDVIEHLPDPASTLRAIRAALRPGGAFAVSTMDVDALFPRLAGRRWPWYMQMHLVYFSRRTLGELLRREGFEVADVRRHRRIVRVSYLASRLEPYSRTAHRVAAAAVRRAGIADRKVGVDLGDIFTVVARKPVA
jgi:2-polyprenyl-3-methyl-5-hydroxy-6-metoxy-1,4-benzoquinol methylase